MTGSVREECKATPLRKLAALLAIAGFASALALVPAQAVEDGDTERGGAAYEASCATCHANPARIMARVSGDDDAGKAEALEAFLPDHHAEDDQDRADIIAYMLSL